MHDRGAELDREATAQEVAHLVRKTMVYGSINEPAVRPLDPENINDFSGKVACHGYTIVTSEALEWLEIPHEVASVGNHSFILVHGEKDDSRLLLDFPSDWMDGQVGEYIEQADDGGTVINTEPLLVQKDYNTYMKIRNNLEWVVDDSRDGVDRFKRGLELFPPEMGREIVRHRFNQRWAIINGRAGKAAMSMAMLKAYYPK